MRNLKRTILFTTSALLLAGPALTADESGESDRDQQTVTAEQRQKAMEERRKAVHSLPAEQRAAVREAHRNAAAKDGSGHRQRSGERRHSGGGMGRMGCGR